MATVKYIMSEKDLIEMCLEGNQMAYKTLYEKYGPVLMAIAYRYSVDEFSAEDILQESFIKIFNSLGSFNKEGSFEGWMKRIVINTSLNAYKKRKNKQEIFELENWNDDNYSSEDVIESMSAQEILDVIADLPDGYKMIFNLYVIEGFSHNEIGEMLGTNAVNSRSQLAKAKRKLRTVLEKKGVAYLAG